MTGSRLGDVTGFIGAATILGGFAYQTLRNAAPDIASTLMNLMGALLLAVSLILNYNLPALCLEIAWAALALIGLLRLVTAR